MFGIQELRDELSNELKDVLAVGIDTLTFSCSMIHSRVQLLGRRAQAEGQRRGLETETVPNREEVEEAKRKVNNVVIDTHPFADKTTKWAF